MTSCGAPFDDYFTCIMDATPPYEDWVRWPGGSGTSYSYVLNPGDDELWADDDGARGIGAEPLPLADGVATCGDVEADPAFRDRCWTQLPQMVQGCGPAYEGLMTCWYETEARVRGGLDCALTCPPAPPPTPAPAASGGACDAIDVAGTDYGLVTGFAYDGLYEEAGACNGQPYYKCTCCTAYDPARDVDDPDECLSEKNFHHYVWYDGAAWQLRLYTGGAGDMWGWDECGGGSGWGDEYRLEDPDGDLAAASVEGTWEKQETDFAGGDMVYLWNDHAMTATCVAGSSASAASGFSAILAGERGLGPQTLLVLALLVLLVLCLFCCARPRPRQACCRRRRGRRKKKTSVARPRRSPRCRATGCSLPGPALAGHERTFCVKMPADARAPRSARPPARRSTSARRPGPARARPSTCPGTRPCRRPRRGRARTSRTTCRPGRAAAAAAVDDGGRATRGLREGQAPAPHVASVKVRAPAASSKTAAAPPPPPPGMVDLVVPPKAVPFTRVTRTSPTAGASRASCRRARDRATTSTCRCPRPARPAAAATAGGSTMLPCPRAGPARFGVHPAGRPPGVADVPDGARPATA